MANTNWRDVMGHAEFPPLNAQDLAHLDALWAQASLHDDDESAYLAGIGAMWPSLRPHVFWAIHDAAEKAADQHSGAFAESANSGDSANENQVVVGSPEKLPNHNLTVGKRVIVQNKDVLERLSDRDSGVLVCVACNLELALPNEKCRAYLEHGSPSPTSDWHGVRGPECEHGCTCGKDEPKQATLDECQSTPGEPCPCGASPKSCPAKAYSDDR